MNPPVYDSVGKEVLPGTYIVYGAKNGSEVLLRFARAIRREDLGPSESRLVVKTTRKKPGPWKGHREIEIYVTAISLSRDFMVVDQGFVPGSVKEVLDGSV